MKKLGALILAAVAMLAVVTPAQAQKLTPAQKKQVAALTAQLNRLPNAANPASRITSILNRLVKLQPSKGQVYLNTGLRKLRTGNPGDFTRRNATNIATDVNTLVSRSKLITAGVKARTIQLMKSVIARYIARAPQPPYQA